MSRGELLTVASSCSSRLSFVQIRCGFAIGGIGHGLKVRNHKSWKRTRSVQSMAFTVQYRDLLPKVSNQ
ncbi:hypothetical protein EJB05_18261, partial [Eragrostis curvula]